MNKVDGTARQDTSISHEGLRDLHYQIECTRFLLQIEARLREIRYRAEIARLSREGEPGYVPPQNTGDAGEFRIPEEEQSARSVTLRCLYNIEDELNRFIGVIYEWDHPIDLLVFLMHLHRTICCEMRKDLSLNDLCFLGDWLERDLIKETGRFAGTTTINE
jgi:hypothetical protein